MKTTVGIVNWNSGRFLEQCIESVLRLSDTNVLVVDNASTDGSTDFLAAPPGTVTYIANPENRGFAGGVNQIFAASGTPYVLILNPDVRILPDSIRQMEDFIETHPRVAAVGGYAGEKYLPRTLPTPWSLVMENLGMPRGKRSVCHGPKWVPDTAAPSSTASGFCKTEQVAAAALMIRREACKKSPVFDETFYPAWYEDVDFCRRLQRDNWEVFFARQAEFPHSGGYSAKTMGTGRFVCAYYRNQVRYARKWFRWYEVAMVRAALVAGALGRMIARPSSIAGYGKVLFGALIAW